MNILSSSFVIAPSNNLNTQIPNNTACLKIKKKEYFCLFLKFFLTDKI